MWQLSFKDHTQSHFKVLNIQLKMPIYDFGDKLRSQFLSLLIIYSYIH